MGLREIDRNLLDRCTQGRPGAWEDFVDRFMGLVIHVVNHTAQSRSVRLSAEDREDLISEVFLNILKDDYNVLRHFRGQSSLATYLTVVARRIVVRRLLHAKSPARLVGEHAGDGGHAAEPQGHEAPAPEQRIGNAEEVQRLLSALDPTEARIVRMFHLEGNSYREISSAVGIPENTVGPILSRARTKMRDASVKPAAG